MSPDPPAHPMRPLATYWWAWCSILIVAFLLFAGPVPASNEWIYLLGPYKVWHPSFLSNDWGFSQPWWEHLLFNVVAGAPTLALPLPVVAWGGRIVTWALCAWALVQLGRRLGMGPARTVAAIILWLLFGQTLYGGEWMIETFEAKPFAYASLIFALDGLMANRFRRAGLLLGLTFTIHPSVGLSGGVAALVGAAFLRPTLAQWRSLIGWGTVTGLPGLVLLLPVLLSESGASGQEWRFLATVRLPQIFQPFSPGRRYVLISFAMLAVIVLHGRYSEQGSPSRLLARFITVLGAFTLFGMVVTALGHYEWLKLFPYRLFPLFSLLGFFLVLAANLGRVRSHVQALLLTASAVILMPIATQPLHAIPAGRARLHLWHDDPELQRALEWVAAETPASARLLAPPWRPEVYYYGRRAVVANWQAIRYDALTEWRTRIEDQVGPLTNASLANMEQGYFSLKTSDVLALARKYDVDYIITISDYPFPIVHQTGPYLVYRMVIEAGSSNPVEDVDDGDD